MAGFFVRGATPPGGRDGTAFNNSLNRAEAMARSNQARATQPYSKFTPDVAAAQQQRVIVRAPTGVPSERSELRAGAKVTLAGQGTHNKVAEVKHGAPLPPGLRPAAAAARMPSGPRRVGEYGVPIGGQPLGPQVGHTGHMASARPLALSIHRQGESHLPKH